MHNVIDEGLAQLDAMPLPTYSPEPARKKVLRAQSAIDSTIEDEESNSEVTASPVKKSKSGKRDAAGVPSSFTVTDLGVFYKDDDDNPHWICSRLDVEALVRDGASENWGRLLAWKDADRVQHRWSLPMELLKSDGADMRGELARMGLDIAPSIKARTKLSEYVVSAKPNARARCVTRTGWHGQVFVLPDRTIGKSKEMVIYQSEMTHSEYSVKGTLQDWQENVSRYCSGNPRMLLALSTAFAGMLLNLAGEESGGIHFVGNSSTGKTTALRAACSVYGPPSYLHRWRATANGLEGLAAMHNDTLLVLDELSQCEPREAGQIAYMLANGSGKARAARTGKAKPSQSWHLLFLSAGEIGLAQHMSEGGRKVKAGQQVRLVEIGADAGAGYGMFDTVHDCADGAELSKKICDAASQCYGVAAIAFLEALTGEINSIEPWLKKEVADFVRTYLPSDASGQASRVCSRFALIAMAGEYATNNGVTGWQPGEAMAAAGICFQSWLETRGGAGNQESKSVLSHVKAFFESHEESRFTDFADSSSRPTFNRAGYRRTGDNGEVEYLVFPEAFKEICTGYDPKMVSKALVSAGWIRPAADGRSQRAERIPGKGPTKVHLFTNSMWRD